MPKELKKIIKELFINQKINKLQETEKDIKVLLGKNFLNKHIKNIFLQKDKIIIEANTIEAKTELTIVKKNFKTVTKLL